MPRLLGDQGDGLTGPRGLMIQIVQIPRHLSGCLDFLRNRDVIDSRTLAEGAAVGHPLVALPANFDLKSPVHVKFHRALLPFLAMFLPARFHTARANSRLEASLLTFGAAGMNTQTRITIHVSLWLIIAVAGTCASAGQRPTATPSLCTRLAAQMQRSPETVVKDAASASTDWLPWIVSAKPDQPAIFDYDFYRRIAAAWQARMGPMNMQGIETLPGSNLLMAFGYAGSMDCLYSMFVVEKPGGAMQVLDSSPDVSGQCEREGGSGGLAAVLGRPAYLESTRLGPNNDSLLLVVPWLGTAWGDSCPVSISFRYRQPVRLVYCGSDRAVCSAARKVAPSLERQCHAYSAEWIDRFTQGAPLSKFQFRFGGVAGAPGNALVAQARRITMSNLPAPPSHGPPSILRPVSLWDIASFFPLRLEHKLYLAAVTGGMDPTSVLTLILPGKKLHLGRPAPDSLLVLYQAPRAQDHRLATLAILSMQWQTSALASVQAQDDSTP